MNRLPILALLLLAPAALLAASPLEHELRLIERDVAYASMLLREDPERGLEFARAVEGDLRDRLESVEARRSNLPQTEVIARRLLATSNELTWIAQAVGHGPESNGGVAAMSAAGSISGQIIDEATSEPLGNIQVRVLTLGGSLVFSTSSSSDGTYTLSRLAAGTYKVAVVPFNGYIGEEYPSPVEVTWIGDTPGIDFELTLGGRISGSLRRAEDGAPIHGLISIYDATGALEAVRSVNSSLPYLSLGLPAGTYFAVASAFGGLGNQLFENLDCITCSPLTGTPISVTAGNITPGVDFSLKRWGRISGTVLESGSSHPIRSATVLGYDADGNLHNTAFTNESGSFAFAPEMPGTYYVRVTASSLLYQGELFEEIACDPDCIVTAGTPVMTAFGENRAGVDFTLENSAGRIRGTVTGSETGLPLKDILVDIYHPDGTRLARKPTDADGQYSFPVSQAGDYHLLALAPLSSNYFDEVFDGIPCLNCNPTGGTPVPVAFGSTTGSIDFNLDLMGSIEGRVTDAVTGQPLQGVRVSTEASASHTDANGKWRVQRLQTGVYHAHAQGPPGSTQELYDDIPCAMPCDLSAGTPISVIAGSTTAGIDFALTPGGTISGSVMDVVFGEGVRSSLILYDETGAQINSYSSPAEGGYTVGPIPAGTYFLLASATTHVDQVYPGISCEGGECTVTDGTPITVSSGADTPGIDFLLDPLVGRVSGRVTDAVTGAPVSGIDVEFLLPHNFVVNSAVTGADGTYLAEGFAGDYYVRARSEFGHAPKLYDDRNCPGECPVALGEPVTVVAGAVTSGIDFTVSRFGLQFLRPGYGGTSGGERVKVLGQGFLDGISVLFDGTPAEIVSVAPNAIEVITPSHSPGNVDVEIVNGSGESRTIESGFRFESPRRPEPRLVTDINLATAATHPPSPISQLTPLGGQLLFFRSDADHGFELWVSDAGHGTGSEARLVRDITPGPASSNVQNLTTAEGFAAFRRFSNGVTEIWRSDGTFQGTFQIATCELAEDLFAFERSVFFSCGNELGKELWRTDGTVAGTGLVRDILPGPESSEPAAFATIRGSLYFSAIAPGAGGEIWTTDGTYDGTRLALELVAGSSSLGIWSITGIGDHLYIVATNGVGDFGIFVSDGTQAGTAQIHVTKTEFLGQFTHFDGFVYFASGPSLWRTDGTPEGTTQIREFPSGHNPRHLTSSNDIFYFFTGFGSLTELWRTDGSSNGTLRIANLGTLPKAVIASGDLLLFDSSVEGMDTVLWSSDGSAEGTRPLGATHPADVGAFARMGEQIFVTGLAPTREHEIWSTDGTEAGTVQLTRLNDLGGTASSSPRQFARSGNRLFFVATHGGEAGLYVSDGTNSGTELLFPGNVSQVTELNGSVVFALRSGATRQIWRSWGTLDTTSMVAAFPDNTEFAGTPWVRAANVVYFNVQPPAGATRLFRTDGTASGTFSLFDTYIQWMVNLDGTLFFLSTLPGATGLFRTDGLPETTASVLSFTEVYGLAEAGGMLFFHADGSLWASDGTAAGSSPIKSGSFSITDRQWPVLNGKTYFVENLSSGQSLYQTDGTPAGTVPIVSLGPLGGGALSRWLVAANGLLFFNAWDLVHGNEVWVSDGTAEGTRRLEEIYPGFRYNEMGPRSPRVANGLLYFVANDGIHGFDLWRSDGTPEGTFLYHDADGAAPSNLLQVGSHLFFAGDGPEGVELRAIDVGPPVAIAAVAPRSGHHGGGMAMTVTGANFTNGVDTRFGGIPLQAPLFVSTTEVTGVTPLLKPGKLYDVSVHNGESSTLPRAFLSDFLDVGQAHPLHPAVESIFRSGITAGCGGGNYCVNAGITRAQMAVFLLRGIHGSAYVPPPATGTMFGDVPPGSFAADWIEQLAVEGISAGCGAGNFCPNAPVTRSQMAVFLLRMKHGAGYTPPPETGIFADVPPGSFAAAWIEQLYREGVTGGCSAAPLLYCPAAETTRGQMAVFVKKALALP